jgi:hypothetical protein
MWKRQAKWLFFPLPLLVAALWFFYAFGPFEGGTSRRIQQQFDRRRLNDILAIARLINEYESKTGHFPFADRADGKPVAVVIATKEQLARDKGRAPIMLDLKSRAVDGEAPAAPQKIEKLTLEELTKELESGLGRSVTLPCDPQRVPVNKPSVYVFTCYLGVFDVSAYLHNALPFARKLGEFNYKVAVGSRSNGAAAIWTCDELRELVKDLDGP